MNLADILPYFWFWGIAGAFVSAGSDWIACAFSQKGLAFKCSIEFLYRLAAGAIAAEMVTPQVMKFLSDDVMAQPVAGMVGLIANATFPGVIRVLSTRVTNVLKAGAEK